VGNGLVEIHPPPPQTLSSYATKLFNDFIVVSAINAADSCGLFQSLHDKDALSVSEICVERSLGYDSVFGILDVLSSAEIIQLDSPRKTFSKGPYFDEIICHLGYFLWLARGYGASFLQWAATSSDVPPKGPLIGRDGFAVAESSALIGRCFVDPTLKQVILDEPFAKICDLGCGNANRLIQIISGDNDATGVGVELDKKAADLAVETVRRINLQHRISIYNTNVKDISAKSALYQDVDLLLMCFMGHDLWPAERAKIAFLNFRESFKSCTRFIMADTVRVPLKDDETSQQVPIFRLGFQAVHSMMRQYLPSHTEWLELFNETGWQLKRTIPLGVSDSIVYELKPN
jgi:phenylpyruvate C(3)-methyltransferase